MTTPRSPEEQRELVLLASEGTCPRCGAARAPEQEYCVDCGLRLPLVTGRLAAFRRRWIRRFGWYPGDWAWLSLLTLLVAVAGAAVAIAVTHHRRAASGRTVVTPTVTGLRVHAPAPPVASPTPAATLPAAPEPTTTAPKRGAVRSWPTGRNGWTIVLVSYPSANGQPSARQTATRALHAGLAGVGLLDSSDYASLQPGYVVVFTGVYGSQSAAESGLATAHAAGFTGAYVRQVAR